MGENSKIEWTRHTWNPWIGCTRVGPPCDHCYAEQLMDARYGRVRWGAGEDRVRTAAATWALPFRWDRAAAIEGRRHSVFCLSLGDIWDNEVDPQWRNAALQIMQRTPNLIYLLLSKRIGNAEKMCDPARGNHPLPRNAALGSTFGDQDDYDRDAAKLKQAAANLGALFTFASIEPMLGPVVLDERAPDWIICGGESGRNARQMDPVWPRAVMAVSAKLGRAFFMKQMTGRAPIPTDLLVRQFPEPLR
jgi:protein gp37